MPKILIDMGQSNQSGRGDMSTMSAQYKTVLSNVKMWTGSQFDSMDYSINNNQFPVSSQSNQGGSEFVRSVALANYFGETVYRISYAVGSTFLTDDHSPASTSWNTVYKTALYAAALDTVNNAIIYLWNTLKVRGPISLYFFWNQGEADTASLAWQQEYQQNITDLINGIRGTISGTSVVKSVFIISRTNTLIYNTGTDTVVTAATNATPIEITTQGNNSAFTGGAVRIVGALGNTAANGRFTVTDVSATKFTLDTSVGNGVWTSGGVVNYLPYAPEIAQSQADAVAALSNAYSLSTDAYALAADGAHFTMAGYEAKGQAEANIIINNNL